MAAISAMIRSLDRRFSKQDSQRKDKVSINLKEGLLGENSVLNKTRIILYDVKRSKRSGHSVLREFYMNCIKKLRDAKNCLDRHTLPMQLQGESGFVFRNSIRLLVYLNERGGP